jgi:uncharacterized repeat protein (TIGR03803 family)
MRNRKTLNVLLTALALVWLILMRAAAWASSEELVLHSFNGRGGYVPMASLVLDTARNLYGTTSGGGAGSCTGGCGTVFRLEPGTNGKWTEILLHSFTGRDGAYPSARLTWDVAGNLYGTTQLGGAHNYGTVFKLAPGSNHRWSESVLHSFNGKEGGYPSAGLTFDAAGNLYGTTSVGPHHAGTIFKLTPTSTGRWSKTVVHAFWNEAVPLSNLIFDAQGGLYGTTFLGGAGGVGFVFQLLPGANGKWTMTTLHTFDFGKDGGESQSALIFDAAGNLYGMTGNGAGDLYGVVFKLTPGSNGGWTETVLHSFNWGSDGAYPVGDLIFDAAGNLYGVTDDGGGGNGSVFELATGSNGQWTETILHSFSGAGDGVFPYSGPIMDAAGHLYGATANGGANRCNCGVVYEVIP